MKVQILLSESLRSEACKVLSRLVKLVKYLIVLRLEAGMLPSLWLKLDSKAWREIKGAK